VCVRECEFKSVCARVSVSLDHPISRRQKTYKNKNVMTDKATSIKKTFPVNNNEKTRFEERVSQNQLLFKPIDNKTFSLLLLSVKLGSI